LDVVFVWELEWALLLELELELLLVLALISVSGLATGMELVIASALATELQPMVPQSAAFQSAWGFLLWVLETE